MVVMGLFHRTMPSLSSLSSCFQAGVDDIVLDLEEETEERELTLSAEPFWKRIEMRLTLETINHACYVKK